MPTDHRAGLANIRRIDQLVAYRSKRLYTGRHLQVAVLRRYFGIHTMWYLHAHAV